MFQLISKLEKNIIIHIIHFQKKKENPKRIQKEETNYQKKIKKNQTHHHFIQIQKKRKKNL